MNFLQLFRRQASAPVARDRLQILLAHERVQDGRTSDGRGDLIAVLQEEILAVIARHIAVDREKVKVKLDRDGGTSMLEIDIEMPGAGAPEQSPSPA